ncbi:hypothetical protein G7Z17_g5403 [Cylindrodendrum hubeiense]|uniref:Uncharacterized protein n=1 Tax=Cylindrodendrum hubeiense TaxID=595255 RepID=A0A9P5H6S9_9HYPO|nr:hypothetical protein G7Z17_g5403 [Cylindrodendrum hubeiense]
MEGLCSEPAPATTGGSSASEMQPTSRTERFRISTSAALTDRGRNARHPSPAKRSVVDSPLHLVADPPGPCSLSLAYRVRRSQPCRRQPCSANAGSLRVWTRRCAAKAPQRSPRPPISKSDLDVNLVAASPWITVDYPWAARALIQGPSRALPGLHPAAQGPNVGPRVDLDELALPAEAAACTSALPQPHVPPSDGVDGAGATNSPKPAGGFPGVPGVSPGAANLPRR